MKATLKYVLACMVAVFSTLNAEQEAMCSIGEPAALIITDTIKYSIDSWYYTLKSKDEVHALAQLELCLNAFYTASAKQEANEKLRIALHDLISNGLQIEVTAHCRENWETLIQRVQLLKNKAADADYNWYMIELQLDQPENIEVSEFLAESSKFRAQMMSTYLTTEKVSQQTLTDLGELLHASSDKFTELQTALAKLIEQNTDTEQNAFQGLIYKKLFVHSYQATLFQLLAIYNKLGTLDAKFDLGFELHIALERVFYAYLYELFIKETGATSISPLIEAPKQFSSLSITELPQPCAADFEKITQLQAACS
jgi:hypothetical protein